MLPVLLICEVFEVGRDIVVDPIGGGLGRFLPLRATRHNVFVWFSGAPPVLFLPRPRKLPLQGVQLNAVLRVIRVFPLATVRISETEGHRTIKGHSRLPPM
jgi:hypothetical protein